MYACIYSKVITEEDTTALNKLYLSCRIQRLSFFKNSDIELDIRSSDYQNAKETLQIWADSKEAHGLHLHLGQFLS